MNSEHNNGQNNLGQVFSVIHRMMIDGSFYKDILDSLFDIMVHIIPYDRISVAVVDEAQDNIKSDWVKSKLPIIKIGPNYAAPLKGSSLKLILDTNLPRIIPDLEEYLHLHPKSQSTRDALSDGIKSSLTCPLKLEGQNIGVIFFSSQKAGVYNENHIRIFMEIAEGFSLVVQQGFMKKAFSKMNLQDKMFRDALHDINNPLFVIQGTLDMIARKEWFKQLTEESKKAFKIIRKSSDTMNKLVHEIVYTDSKQLNAREVALKEFFNEILEECQILGYKKDITFHLKMSHAIALEAILDKNILKEAILNLIINAIKYSPRSSHVELIVSTELTSKVLKVIVSDQGQGIPTNELSGLFKEFGKTSVQTTEGEPSRGLGLYSVKNLINTHHGDVFVDSVEGKGSDFGFWIPYS